MGRQLLIPTFVFDVAGLPEDQQFAAWAAHVANSRASRPIDRGPFTARVQFWQMDPLLVSAQQLDAFCFHRDAAKIRATPADHYQLVVVFEGTLRFVRPGGDVLCEAGGACLTDLTRPEEMHATSCRTVAVNVARWFLDEAVSPRDAHGPLPRTPAAKVLVDFVGALVRELPQMPASSASPMSRVLRDLLATVLAELPPRPSAAEARSPVRQRVRAYIEAEPMGALSLERMCDALGLTRSTINRAFKAEGGVMAYDRRRRLVALHGRLSDPTESRGIAELGYDYGFPEKTHLSRAFREAFGYAPSELRRQATAMSPHVAEPGSLQDTFKIALRRLS